MEREQTDTKKKHKGTGEKILRGEREIIKRESSSTLIIIHYHFPHDARIGSTWLIISSLFWYVHAFYNRLIILTVLMYLSSVLQYVTMDKLILQWTINIFSWNSDLKPPWCKSISITLQNHSYLSCYFLHRCLSHLLSTAQNLSKHYASSHLLSTLLNRSTPKQLLNPNQ